MDINYKVALSFLLSGLIWIFLFYRSDKIKVLYYFSIVNRPFFGKDSESITKRISLALSVASIFIGLLLILIKLLKSTSFEFINYVPDCILHTIANIHIPELFSKNGNTILVILSVLFLATIWILHKKYGMKY